MWSGGGMIETFVQHPAGARFTSPSAVLRASPKWAGHLRAARSVAAPISALALAAGSAFGKSAALQPEVAHLQARPETASDSATRYHSGLVEDQARYVRSQENRD